MADLAAKTTAQILGPDGTPIEKPAVWLTADDAQLLRDYQRWGEVHGLYATMTCTRCQKPVEVYVQGDIGFFCDCRLIMWKAS